jgi:transcriptional regulator with XRE-family HTH domain
MDINQCFSQNLARIRKTKGLSLRELAEKTGISYRMIFHYENSPSAVPFKNIKTLADALGVRIAEFFAEDKVSPIDTIDVRLIKKVQELKSLSEADRKEINQHINSLLEKARLRKDQVAVTTQVSTASKES